VTLKLLGVAACGAAILAACNGSVTYVEPGGCVPGSTRACYGPGQCSGTQVCNTDGTGWGSCDCGTGASGNTGGYGASGNAGGWGATGNAGGWGATGNAGGWGAYGAGGAGASGNMGGSGATGNTGGVGGSAGSGGCGGVCQWDATAEFSPIDNPFGAWQSGWTETLGSTFGVFAEACVASFGCTQWYAPALGIPCEWVGGSPHFWKNSTLQTWYGVAPGQLAVHPGQMGEYAVLRWTAPLSADCTVYAQFFAGHDGDTDAHVLHNNVTIFFAPTTNPSTQFSQQIPVIAGDTLDWVVGSKGDWWSDNTPISAVVTCGNAAQWNEGPGANHHCYQLMNNGSQLDWEVARDNALALGGHLATLTSAAEDTWVYQNIVMGADAWFGGYQSNSGAPWRWVTGEPWSYTNWRYGQPDGGEGWPERTFFYNNPEWDDCGNTWVDRPNTYIVEYDTGG
jgi:hypothetical protein